jgi:O-antigen/teichoic acid export membrane protein
MLGLLQFGGWMTLSNVVAPVMVNMDRFFIGFLISITAVSYYVTPFEIVTRLLILPTALVGVLFPVFGIAFMQDRADLKRVYRRSVRWVALLLGPAVLLVILLASPLLALWLKSPEFTQYSTRPLQILAAGVFMNGMAMVPFSLIQGAGRPDVTAKLHVLELVAYLPLLYFLALHWGITGVAAAWLLRASLDTLLLFVYVRRVLFADPQVASAS